MLPKVNYKRYKIEPTVINIHNIGYKAKLLKHISTIL